MFTINALSQSSFATDTRLKDVFLGVNKKVIKEDMHDYISLSKWPSRVGLGYISSAKPIGTGHASREMASNVPPYVLISGGVVKRPRAWQA